MTSLSVRSDVCMLVVQWSGDYGEAYQQLTAGGAENYYAQRYSVEMAGELAKRYAAYGVLCLTGSPRSDDVMPNGVRAMSTGLGVRTSDWAVAVDMIDRFGPTHLVVTTPQLGLLEWALTRGVALLPMFADTFFLDRTGSSWLRGMARAWRHAAYCRRMAGLLNDHRIRWVGNHNLNACRDLVRIRVLPHKVVPWDWPPVVRPDDYEPKTLDPDPAVWSLVFVGTLTPNKGVGDAIASIAELRRRGRPVKLRVIGRGEMEPYRQQAAACGVTDLVDFAGPRSHAEVLAAMRDADLALVPSWHSYPEGLPMTIYEGLAVRTPVICSDHPAFRGRMGDGRSTVSVPERSPLAIADAVEGVLTDPDCYRRMSEATADTWSKLVCPVTYYDLIGRWAADTPEDDRWLASYSLASGSYD